MTKQFKNRVAEGEEPVKLRDLLSRRQALELATKTLLGGAVALVGTFGVSGCGAGSRATGGDDSLSPDQARSLALNKANRQQFEKLVAEVEPHLVLQPGGTLALKPSATRAAGLSTEAKEFAESVLAKTNSLVEAGEARFDENFNVVLTGQTRANYTRWSGWRWWGGVFSMSTNSINALDFAIKGAGVSGAVKFFMQASVAASWATFVAPLIVGAWMWTIKYVNRTGGYRGVHLNVTWAGVIVVTPQ